MTYKKKIFKYYKCLLVSLKFNKQKTFLGASIEATQVSRLRMLTKKEYSRSFLDSNPHGPELKCSITSSFN